MIVKVRSGTMLGELDPKPLALAYLRGHVLHRRPVQAERVKPRNPFASGSSGIRIRPDQGATSEKCQQRSFPVRGV
jgi:hypothetical protein